MNTPLRKKKNHKNQTFSRRGWLPFFAVLTVLGVLFLSYASQNPLIHAQDADAQVIPAEPATAVDGEGDDLDPVIPVIDEAIPPIIEETPAVTEEVVPPVIEEIPVGEVPAVTEEVPVVTKKCRVINQDTPAVTEETPPPAEEVSPATEEVPTPSEETAPPVTEENPAVDLPTVPEDVPPAEEIPVVTEEIIEVVGECPEGTEEVPDVIPSTDGPAVAQDGEGDLSDTEAEDVILPDNLDFEENQPLSEGYLLSQTDQPNEIGEVSKIKLAEVEIQGKNPGDIVTLDEAIGTLIALTTTAKDIEKTLIESVLKQNSTDITRVILADQASEEILSDSAQKGFFQSLESKVEETMAQKDVRQDLAESLEKDPEVEDVLDLILTDDVRNELIRRSVENSFRIPEEKISLEDNVTDLIKNDYNKFVLQELVSNKLTSDANAQGILAEAVSKETEPTLPEAPARSIIRVVAHGLRDNVVIPPENLRFEAGSIVLIVDPIRQFVPGVYKIQVDINNPITGVTETIIQDFAWGVLSMNAGRDIYQVGEEATINIGILNDEGKPVCDAEAILEVQSPSGSIGTPEVKNTGICEVLDPLNIEPDYVATYTSSDDGQYALKLTATLADGTSRTMTRMVTVTRSPEYIIERKAATRLYPVGEAPMSIDIYFFQDFDGTISDVVPSDFEIGSIESTGNAISTNGDQTLSEDGETKNISWQVQATAGNSQSFRYFYDAPDISPEFYTVGPLSGTGTLLEKRSWQIANDAPAIVTDANISINSGTGTGGTFKVGDQIIVTWNNSVTGDNNSGLTAITANLTGWGGGATATMTDTTACGGAAGNNIYEACYTVVSGSIDASNVNASVTATNGDGPTTTADTSNAVVDNQLPVITANGTLTISLDNGVASVAAVNNGTSNQDKVTQSAVTLSVADGDTTTINLTALTGQAALVAGTQSAVVIPGSLDNASQTFTITVTDNAGNSTTTASDSISVDNQLPTVTTSAISVVGATGGGGAFVTGNTPVGRWDNSASGNNNADTISSVTFDLSNFRSVDTALAGTNNTNIWTAAISAALDSQHDTNNNARVTSVDNAGNITVVWGTNNYAVDMFPPTGTSITPTSTRIVTATAPAFTVSDGTDVSSGINTASRSLQRQEATYSNNSCGTFGSYAGVTYSGTYPNINDSTATGSKCYKYIWSVSDSAGNTSTTTETATIVRVPFNTLTIISGNNQSFGSSAYPIGHTLSQPLQVQVTDGGTNWALAGDITVNYSITSAPASPAASGQALSAPTSVTDANGKAQVSLTLGDRAGAYQVQASVTGFASPAAFTATEENYFDIVVNDNLSIPLNPQTQPSNFASPTVTVTTNAVSYGLQLTPNRWPLSPASNQILNWAASLGFGWNLNLGTITAYATNAGNPAATTVYSCSGDTCQGSYTVNIDLQAAVNYAQPSGTYTNTVQFNGQNVTY